MAYVFPDGRQDLLDGPLHVAAQELAGKLQRIEHLNVTPDLLGPLLTDLVQTGTDRLKQGGKA